MEEKIVYFEKPGKDNTQKVIDLVLEQSKQKNIYTIVLASTKGDTAKAFLEAVEQTNIKLVVIPWQHGFREKPSPFPKDLADELESQNHKVHFSTMLFHTTNLYGNNTPQALANILRIFSQGIKVCVEMIMMAADGGCVDIGQKIIVVAGTGAGADTAVIATAAPSIMIKDIKVHEIICKPL